MAHDDRPDLFEGVDPEEPTADATAFLNAVTAGQHVARSFADWIDSEVAPVLRQIAATGADPSEARQALAVLLRLAADQLDAPSK